MTRQQKERKGRKELYNEENEITSKWVFDTTETKPEREKRNRTATKSMRTVKRTKDDFPPHS